MSISARAVLARFNFDKAKAIRYCSSLARTYPGLTKEYNGYIAQIQNMVAVEVAEMEEVNG